MKYQIEIKYLGYKYRTPWMMEGEFTSLLAARKEAKLIAKDMELEGTRFKLRLIKWSAVTIETIANI